MHYSWCHCICLVCDKDRSLCDVVDGQRRHYILRPRINTGQPGVLRKREEPHGFVRHREAGLLNKVIVHRAIFEMRVHDYAPLVLFGI